MSSYPLIEQTLFECSPKKPLLDHAMYRGTLN